MNFIDLTSDYIERKDVFDAAFERVMRSGHWILGPELEAFEAEFAKLCRVPHCVGVGNGLQALEMALKVSDIKAGDEVLVPAHTFIATWLAVTAVGATPVPVEPAAGRFVPTAEDFATRITSHTRAIVAVHLYGLVDDMDALSELARIRGLTLIEDAAQAHGARFGDRQAGAIGRLGCFSFYPAKNLGACGDGGAVVTADAELDDRLRSLRNYGSREKYVHEAIGTNSRLDELQAALLRIRLERLETDNEQRRERAQAYTRLLTPLAALSCPQAAPGSTPVWHQYVIRLKQRDELAAWLAEHDIPTLIHYPKPVYRHPPYAVFAPGHVTAADKLCDSLLSLPFGPRTAFEDIARICALIEKFCS